MTRSALLLSPLALAVLVASVGSAQTPIGHGFSYQGKIEQMGSPISGSVDLRLTLWDAVSGGNSVAGPQQLDAVTVTGGVFGVEIGFGPGAFSGEERWLEIEVRSPSGVGVFETLQPRQSVVSTPYALHALNAQTSVETIDDMRALPLVDAPPGTLPSVRVLGHTSAGDGGGGRFYWDETSVATDDDGLVFTSTHPNAPVNGRWIRSFSGPVHVSWWNLQGDGSDESVPLAAAFAAAAGRGIVFDEPLIYGFTGSLNIPADTRIENNGATLRTVGAPGGNTSSVVVGDRVHANLLKCDVATGVQVERFVTLGADVDIERIELSSDDQQETLTDNLDGGLQVRSPGVRIGTLRTRKFDRPILVYLTERVVIERLDVQDFVTGILIRESSFVDLQSGVFSNPSPNAMRSSPGHNGILLSGTDISVSNMIIHDAAEHAIRIGGMIDSARIVFNNIQTVRSGGNGLKILPNVGFVARDIQINGLTVVDASYGSTPGANEDGLRLENCAYVTVNGFQLSAESIGISAADGIHINACTNVVINGPRIYDVADDGIHLVDVFGAVNAIFINNPTVVIAGGNGVFVESPTEVLREIHLMNAYITGYSGWGVRVVANSPTVGVNQPMILDGWIKNGGLGAVSLSTTDSDIHNNLTIVP